MNSVIGQTVPIRNHEKSGSQETYGRSSEKGLIQPNTQAGPPSKKYFDDAEDHDARHAQRSRNDDPCRVVSVCDYTKGWKLSRWDHHRRRTRRHLREHCVSRLRTLRIHLVEIKDDLAN